MPSGFLALLDDVATIAKLAASSLDDVTAAAGRAGSKTAAVVIDDTAVTPSYVTGLTPERELPIIGKITLGSFKNKLLFLLPGALLLSAFAPWLITPILMLGGSYLAFEGAEKLLEAIRGDHHGEESLKIADTPEELEERQVAGAIRTDLILSAEIMAIALSTVNDIPVWQQGIVLAIVAIGVTIGVYGTVALIVKLDDIGLHLAKKDSAGMKRFGMGLVHVVPILLKALGTIGTAAMLWVGGGILLHGLEELHVLTALPETIHHFAHDWSGGVGILEWAINAVFSSVVGVIAGAIIVFVLHKVLGVHATHGGEDAEGHGVDKA